MAKTRGPLLSLAASGKLAKALIYSETATVDTARKYAHPTNPKTAAQTSHRSDVAAIVYSWRYRYTNSEIRLSWDRSARRPPAAASPYHAAIAAMIKANTISPDANFPIVIQQLAAYRFRLPMRGCVTGGLVSELTGWALWLTASPTAAPSYNKAITYSGGNVNTGDIAAPAGDYYIQVTRLGQIRSGIFAVHLG